MLIHSEFFFFFAEVGGPVYHLQTSIILDLALTSQTQLCLSNYQCGLVRGLKFICRDNVMTFRNKPFLQCHSSLVVFMVVFFTQRSMERLAVSDLIPSHERGLQSRCLLRLLSN